MLANNAINILLIVFTYALVVIPAMWLSGVVPKQLEARKQRNIAQLTAGAELLADAIARHSGDANHLARLSANYTAHARALSQLGHAVPVLAAAPTQRRAA